MFRGKMSKLFLLILLGALAAIGIWYLKTSPGAGPTIAPPTTPSPDTVESGTIPATQHFTVEGDEFRFSPASISVTRGATVELTFKNVGKAPHNYTIDELGARTKTIDGGKTDVVTFTAPDVQGIITYASYCSVPGHKEAGMEGTIEIK